MPSEKGLASYYASSYRAEHEPGLGPEGAYREELPEARRRVERLRARWDRRTALLELGASSGAFLDSARPFVGNAVGVEPASAHRGWAERELRLDIRPSLSRLGRRRFDCIVLFHVLEHVRHPERLLRDLLALLRPGGFVGVEVPNVDDALLGLYQAPGFAEHYFQNAHLWYFSRKALERLGRAAGGNVQVSFLQRYDLSNHLRWLLTKKPGGAGYYKEVFPRSLDQAYGETLVRAGRADTLWAEFRRRGDRTQEDS